MKLTFLGVWMTPEIGDTVSFVAELSSGERILVDAGANTIRNCVNCNIDPCSITHLVITHSHGDHIAGIPLYLFYRYKYAPLIKKIIPTKLKIITTKPTWDAVSNYIDIAYPNLSSNENIDVILVDYPNGTLNINQFHTMDTFAVKHNPITFGFKLTDSSTGKTIVYSSDTSICDEVFDVAQNADCLIHDVAADCTYPMFAKAGHSLCKDVAEHANNAGVKTLIPVHRLPIYSQNDETYRQELCKSFHDAIIIPVDGDIVTV